MLIDEVVEAADALGATRSRSRKVSVLAGLLDRADIGELRAVVGWLTASPRQGRLGVGWRTLSRPRTEHAARSALTVLDVDAAFDRLAATSGAGSGARRTAVLEALATACTAAEWDFVSRVILGELRTGALDGVLTDAIASAGDRSVAAVRRAAMLTGDLGETAEIALGGSAADLDAVTLEVSRPVSPMLAATAPSVSLALGMTGRARVEYKLDGARIQVHRSADEVRVFTRSLADITRRVPEIVEVVRGLPAREVILDGETLALDDAGAPRPFQDTMARFGSESAAQIALQPWFFDILRLDGRDLLDDPLERRAETLARVAGRWHVPGRITSDPDAAEDVWREALAAGHEGVVVKAVDSLYSAGRRGTGWVKVKPVLTFDLVVLGVEWGSGRRAGLLSNLHLGARDPLRGAEEGFVMVGKTFKGLTDETLRWQTDLFRSRETERTKAGIRVRPDAVVEIAIDGVQRSTRYPGGVALRFARVRGYRPDKPAAESDTIETLRTLLRE
ncbi:ATP-dependent DNA ligase [Microbacterium sp. SSW1-59]|uniref:ATP-dependent DNA ligase n=1 Tax=Microbacterium xanthum TaxID=3079794 RepID=UPI002AD44A72|nr:ATP-dependent DNA ligase [Microbacterium sp. SSW1-59]MDZ8199887.1 ATP-dependent DNA ligase [Microbacterium sp. SSW1-59]